MMLNNLSTGMAVKRGIRIFTVDSPLCCRFARPVPFCPKRHHHPVGSVYGAGYRGMNSSQDGPPRWPCPTVPCLTGRPHRDSPICMAATKVIIDTDAGTDDALGIFMALEAHRRGVIQLLAITTVHGNTTLNNVNNNVLRILRLANLTNIPVYSGASSSLVHPYTFPEFPWHGQDGFGDADLPPQPPASTLLQPQHAITALLDLVHQNSGEVVLIALGPLTNLALAIRQSPTFTSQLAAIYVMGGTFADIGNITPEAEFNFHCDADAAFVVLQEASKPIYLTTWDICLKEGAFTNAERNELGKINTPIADLINKIEANIKDKDDHGDDQWVTCDQLTVAWVIDEAKSKMLKSGTKTQNGFLHEPGKPLVTATNTFYATVDTRIELKDGQAVFPSARGKTLVDRDDSLGRQHNIVLLEAVNTDVYMKYLRLGFGEDI